MSLNNTTLTAEQTLAIVEQLLESGEKQQALHLLVQGFNRTPEHEKLALRLARLLHQHNFNGDALKVLKASYQLGNNSLELSYMLAALMHVERYYQDAESVIKDCLQRHPESAECYNLLGSTYIEMNQYQAAIAAFQTAIKLKPESADAYNNLAWAYRALGQKAEAIAHFQQAFEVNNQATEALSGLLLLKTFNEKTDEFAQVEHLLRQDHLSTKQKSDLQFALGKAYEDINEPEQAFAHYSQANQRWRKSYEYTTQSDERLFSELKQLFSAESLVDLQPEASDQEPQPIFVVGMPRSSTTLIEQILSSHSKVVGAGELPFLEQLLLSPGNQFNWDSQLAGTSRQTLSSNYLSQMRKHAAPQLDTNTRFITDKLPQNFRFIGAILCLFPQAKIIHCKRHPMDTCFSLYKHHFPMARHHYAYDLKELGEYYNLYEDLMQHWHNIAPGKILDIQYEDLLENFETDVKQLLAFCGLEFEANCLAFENNQRVVRTASSDQVRQGLYKSAAGRWKTYEQALAPLKASLRSYS